MATKTQRYDHPAYLVPQCVTVDVGAGAESTGKFTAFTTLLLKSATTVVTVAGTSTAANFNDLEFSIYGTATTSVGSTGNLGTTAAFSIGTNVLLANGTQTMTQGETLVAISGTDGTAQANVTYEFLIAPRASITD